ncbi:MAG TPA: 3-dehydroquinate synthase [Isosphaeraceae bacterium]|nr:3-dehydroquinate synthase [Isosphaeraceae bacterium]
MPPSGSIADSESRDDRVPVELGPRSYVVRVGSGGIEAFGSFVRQALERSWAGQSSQTALIVTDSNLAALGLPSAYAAALSAAGIEPVTVFVPPGEGSKSLAGAAELYDALVAFKADRHTVIVALGGGVIGDLAGFAAATYARGLPLVMVPTTLLAQVDSSVGGKVGINHPDAKNIIGAFHQPVAVWIDIVTLDSLPPREVRCGLAEVVKYGVIMDAPFFADLERDTDAILARDPLALRHIVGRSCRLKAQVVTQDEREETGLRAILNFGHTVGHAIEAVAGYGGEFQHGEAVAAGMVAESRLGQRLGWIGPGAIERLVRLLERFGLPTSAPGLDPDRLLDAMSRDKKNRRGKIRFVLPRAIGRVETIDATSEVDVHAMLAELVSSHVPEPPPSRAQVE